jgi:nitrogen fixation/metabolism regulation signal transduction histidine kinase
MTNSKRRILLVDRGVQWAIVRQSLLHWLGYTVVAALYLVVVELLRGGFKSWSEHWQTIWPLVASLFVSLLILLPMFIYDSFGLSNRFVGPVKRLRRVLRELAQGKPFSPVKFRKGDYWQELAEELNLAVEALRKQRLAEEPAASDQQENSRPEVLETVAK